MRNKIFSSGIFLLCGGFFALGNAADFTSYQRDFRLAWESLTRGNFDTVAELLPNLSDYPLYGYLVYGELNARIDSATNDEVRDFLRRYPDLPVTATLRAAWLKRLAAEERWDDFLADYRASDDRALQCLYSQAQIGLRDQKARTADAPLPPPDAEWMTQVRALWMNGKKQAVECEAIFRVWQESGGMTPADLWERMALAFENGKIDLAADLAVRLPASDRPWAQAWMRIHRNPRSGLDQPIIAQDSGRARMIIAHGLNRLARDNPTTAMSEWRRIKNQYSFPAAEQAKIERKIALRAAINRVPNALSWLEALPADAELLQARIRAALWEENWPAVTRLLRELQPAERTAPYWRYWEARALEKIGQNAEEIYRTLAAQRGYYGFLAADRMNLPYSFNHRPSTINAAELALVESRPAMIRAREWFLLGYLPEGRREWMAAISSYSEGELLAAAQLAARWNWPDRIIATIGKSLEEDDLILRFPLAYRPLISAHAAAAGISPATVFALTRQESIFMADVRSSAGAVGLMQLLPTTAAQVARGLKIASPGNLIDPDTNLRLGSVFLAQLLKRFGSLTLAAAAYNAGPGRIAQWRPRAPQPADLWIELIPFDETRRYVRNVLTYQAIYRWRLNLPFERCAREMPILYR